VFESGPPRPVSKRLAINCNLSNLEIKRKSSPHYSFSTESSILAAPLDSSISPVSVKSGPMDFMGDLASAGKDNDADSLRLSDFDAEFDGPDPLRLSDFDAEFDGATPSPRKIAVVGGAKISDHSGLGSHKHSSLDRKNLSYCQTTPTHLISDSPFKAPLMSTPRQRSYDLQSETKRRSSENAAEAQRNEVRGLCKSEGDIKEEASSLDSSLGGDNLHWTNKLSEDEGIQVDQTLSIGPKNLSSLFDSVFDEEL